MNQIDFKSLNELKIYRNNVYVGLLKRKPLGVELIFDLDFFSKFQGKHLTYKTLIKSQTLSHQGTNLPPFFAGLLPEGLRLKALVNELKTSEDDMFSMLAAVGDKVIGDVFAKTSFPLKNSFTFDSVKSNEVNFYEIFLKSISSINQIRSQDSFSGVQEKISGSMIIFPLRIAKKNKSYILKLNPKDKPNLTYNEHYTLSLAKLCGFKVNKSKLVHDKDQNTGLLVERFDRVFDNKNMEIKIHQEDACQFLNRYPADKYRISIQDICDGLFYLSGAPFIEILNLIKLYIFNYLAGNGDFHGKNISLFTDPKTKQIKLTPCYDLICTLLYGDQTMALKLDGRDSNFKRKYFIEFAERNEVPSKLINREIDKLLNNFNKYHEILLKIPDLKEKDKRHLINSFKTKIDSLKF